MKVGVVHRIGRHTLFWLTLWGFFLLIQLPDYFMTGRPVLWREYLFMQLPTALLATYPLLYGLLPRLLRRQRLSLFLGLLAVWLLASVLLANLMQAFYSYVVAPSLFQQPPYEAFQWTKLFDRLSFNFFALMVIAGGASVSKVLNWWYEQQQRSQELQQHKLQAELQLLKAQLQPSFLFNTLHTLRHLTAQKSPDSPAVVLQLADVLRFMLYESSLDVVPLVDEVEMIRHYVALEKRRLGSRVDVSLSFSGDLGAYTIAPLLLLPFVENAFRHGTSTQLECPWISIDLVVKQDCAIFKVINSQLLTESGVVELSGLGSIRQRLQRLYPGQHELKLITEPDTFLIALSLQFAPQPLSIHASAFL
ncbi:signal transduction histidine kinase, LytS [Hymenobacter roseosalivarius DSM 11622]|uniref:Signal transduction histidine kinase, LytS n=1 Tax=Hymenobacter roseosalivarius DSM 11622 TaxID=645990 RepID=A0A1W1W3Y7_9BACT|nr:sensor histidine kinase [Hymenobacter roseosalivarius]SMC00337.1 signal transduction histidine kinase, LytS [Hymenobacter roseosalivarius DSM 11622]